MHWSPLYRLDPSSNDSVQAYVGLLGKALSLILSCFSHPLPKCCIFGIWKHAICKARQLTLTFLENQLNYPLIGSCGNMSRIDAYEHDDEYIKKEMCYLELRVRVLWNDEL